MAERQRSRRRRSREEAAALVMEFEASDLTRGESCRTRGLSAGSPDLYRKRAAGGAAVRLLPVEIIGEAGREPIGPRDRGGRRVGIGPGFDTETLLRLLDALEAR